MKKNSFKKSLLIYSAALLVIMIVILLYIRGTLVKYEKAQGYNMVNDFCRQLESDLLFNTLENEKNVIDYSKMSKFEDKEGVLKAYIKYFAGRKTESALSSKSFDANHPVYIVKCGEDEAGEVKLSLVSEKTKLGMLSIPTWKLESFTPSLSSIGNAYAINVPENFKVSVNNVLLTESDIASKNNGLFLYLVKGLTLEPEFSIQNGDGENVAFSIEKQETAKNIYSVNADYTVFSFSIPSDFSVASEKSFTKESAGELTTVSIILDKMISTESMNSLFNITDLAGDRMVFTDKNGVPAPAYYEYDLMIPSGYSAKIGETGITFEGAEEIDISATAKQYSDVTKLMKRKIYTVNPVVTDKNAANAANALLTVLTSDGIMTSYHVNNGLIATGSSELKITVPDNFKILINGAAPDVEGVKSEIKEYSEIRKYLTVPDAVTYTLKDQYGNVEIDVIDNLGVERLYSISKDLVILEQSGTSYMPEFAEGAVDPISYAEKWSLFLTDDLPGDSHGYYEIRKYIHRDSYVNTIAYNWAVDYSINFIGNHVFDTPPFSKETVSNYVVLADNAFACDIYFVKSFTVTSNGTHRDDVFSNRLYFMYTDDTNDGVNNPHWVIAAMNEVSAK